VLRSEQFDGDLRPGNASAEDAQVPLNALRAQQQKARLEKELEQVEREAQQRKVECALLTVDIGFGQSRVSEQV